MRPAGRGLLDSLYFRYPKFDFVRPAELDGRDTIYDVAIAGGGPVGLTAAIELARQGVSCVVLDEKDTVNDGSRAICISRGSFETLQQLGVAEPFERKGLGWTRGRCYYGDRMIYRLEMPHSDDERFLPMYNLQQQYIEQFLVDKAASLRNSIDLRWQSEVTGVSNTAGSVRLTIDTPQGQYDLRTKYLIAADGARSRIRKMLGVRLEGENLPGNYVIADVRMDHDFPTERRSFFESAANPDSTLLIHRQPDNIWRVDWQLPPGQDPAEAVEESNVRARIQAILDMIGHRQGWDLEWWSIYTANTLCLDDYRHGPVFFAGDAARIVPIFGVRGLNNGFTDAANIAWKLAYVLRGDAGTGLLESYSPERRGATLDIFRNAGRSSRFMTPPTRGHALLRKAVLQLAVTQDFSRRFADPRQVLPYTYSDSPLTSFPNRDAEFSAGVPAGAAAVNRRIGDDDFLLDHLGPGFTGLYFTDSDHVPDAAKQLLARLRSADRQFRLLVISPDVLEGIGVITVTDERATIFGKYDAQSGTFYLLRPDRHVAARWRTVVLQEAERAMFIAQGKLTHE